MKVEVKELKISNELSKKIDMICRFAGVSSAFSSGCVKNIKGTNITYVKPDYYDNQDFDMYDVKDISKGTTKEDELFDYAGVPSYLKTSKKSHNERDKDDFEMEL